MTRERKTFKRSNEHREQLRIASIQKYYGKEALLKTYEDLGIEPREGLRDEVRKLKTIVENKGAI